jgi:hypothetical protein
MVVFRLEKCVVLGKVPLKNNGEIEKLARKTTVKL